MWRVTSFGGHSVVIQLWMIEYYEVFELTNNGHSVVIRLSYGGRFDCTQLDRLRISGPHLNPPRWGGLEEWVIQGILWYADFWGYWINGFGL